MSEAPDSASIGERIRLTGFAALMVLAGFVLRAIAGLPTLPGSLPTVAQVATQLSAPTLPLAGLAAVLVDVAWLLWLWVMASMIIELLITMAEAVGRGARFVAHARRLADRVTLPIARRAVTAAFALQVLSRPLLASAAPLPDADQTWMIGADGGAASKQDVRSPLATYLVKEGDTLWSISEAAYGSGTEYRRLVEANVGHRMPDGALFTPQGVIRPGWILDVPEPTNWVQTEDGQRWYTVQPGDSLSSIAARTLGDRDRWSELFELNRTTALDAQHTLEDPDLIWPGLRLRLPESEQVTVETPSPEPIMLAAAAIPAVVEPAPVSIPIALETVVPEPPLTEEPTPPPLVRQLHPLPTIQPEQPIDTPAEPPPADHPEPLSSPIVPVAGALGLAAAAGLATLGARRLRLRALPKEPESEVVVSGGYAEAKLTPEFGRHLHGAAQSDPGAFVIAHVQRLLDEFNLDSVRIVAMRHGRSSTTLSLSAGLAQQTLLLDLAPEFAKRLEAETEAWTSSDHDVQLRFCRLRKSRLLPPPDASDQADRTCFVPLGVLYDRQVFSVAWSALGHVLVASPPGRGMETIVTSLLATVTARRSPHQLRLWLVGRPRTMPGPIEALPHLDVIVDPGDEQELDGLIARLRAELDQRALGGAWPDVVVVVPEMTGLGERAADVQLLACAAAPFGVRLMCGTTDPASAALSPLLSSFTTRMVMHMDAEESSMALLGTADAAYVGGGGRLLLRLEDREPVEMYGYQVSPDHLERLVRVMRSAYSAVPVPEPMDVLVSESEFSPQPAADPEPDSNERSEAAAEAETISITVGEPQAHSGAPIQIRCFGAPRVLVRGVQVWPQPSVGEAKPWEFLLFIACHPPEGAAREAITEALWPEAAEEEDPTHRFRQLRYRLRNAFRNVPGGPRGDGIGLERHGALYLKPDVVYSDAREFQELTRAARIFSGLDSIPRLERARSLYTGDLLLGPDTRRYSWVDERDPTGVTFREHFRRQYLQATLTLAELCTEHDRGDDAIKLYTELTELEPGDESVWRALFRVHAHRGDLPALMRAERQMRNLLRDLAVREGDSADSISGEPSVVTTAEYERLLATLQPQRSVAVSVS